MQHVMLLLLLVAATPVTGRGAVACGIFRDFDAVGDNKTDDTAAIRRALEICAEVRALGHQKGLSSRGPS